MKFAHILHNSYGLNEGEKKKITIYNRVKENKKLLVEKVQHEKIRNVVGNYALIKCDREEAGCL